MLSNSGPFTDKKFTLHSVATALANNVFPHPGGPKRISKYNVDMFVPVPQL